MLSNSYDFVRPADATERDYLESLVREDYDRCHPGDTFEEMKRRASFSKEDQGLYRDWLAATAARAEEIRTERAGSRVSVTAEVTQPSAETRDQLRAA